MACGFPSARESALSARADQTRTSSSSTTSLSRRAEGEPARPEDLVFPLSARNEDQLREAAIRLTEFLQQNRVNLNDVAYTLQQGRKSFEHRLAIAARTAEELIDKLTCFIDGKSTEDIATGHVKGGEGVTRLLSRREKQEFIRLVSEGRDPRKIAGLWAEGLLADWQGFQSQRLGKENLFADLSLRRQATLGLR